MYQISLSILQLQLFASLHSVRNSKEVTMPRRRRTATTDACLDRRLTEFRDDVSVSVVLQVDGRLSRLEAGVQQPAVRQPVSVDASIDVSAAATAAALPRRQQAAAVDGLERHRKGLQL